MTRRDWAIALGIVLVFTVVLIVALVASYPPRME